MAATPPPTAAPAPAQPPFPPTRPWYHPLTLARAWTRGRRVTDAAGKVKDEHLRDFTRMLIQGGGMSLALVMAYLLYVGMTRVATSLDKISDRTNENTAALHATATAVSSHLEEDKIKLLADQVTEKVLQAQHAERSKGLNRKLNTPVPQSQVTAPPKRAP